MKLSIITVNLNNKDGLQKTIDSIVSQTNKNFEWIVIDGGSTDGSKEFIEDNKNHITYWVSEPDKGIYDAMNKGIAKSSGDYLLFINSGDYLCSNDIVEKIVNDKNFGKYDIMAGHTLLSCNDKIIKTRKAPHIINVKFLIKDTLCHQSSLIRSSHLKENGGYNTNYKIISDFVFLYEDLIIRNASYKPIHFKISVYDLSGISTTNRALLNKEKNDFLHKKIPPEIIRDYLKKDMGNTRLEKILYRYKEDSFFYKWITILAIISFSPQYLSFQFKKFFKRITTHNV